MKATVLVVGGAGYIGSHASKALKKAGYEVVVLDNLSRGWADFAKWGELIKVDLADRAALDALFKSRRIDAVMHFAAFAYVGESVVSPAPYYRNNIANALNLLEAMVAANCKKIVFSSTCATYGEPVELPITETHPQNPINPYGFTKLAVERMLADFDAAYGLKAIPLRYFNAAGADPDGEVGERHDPETHLVPLVIDAALGKRGEVAVFGEDYPTPDGTCVRDYIHVSDLADAHVLALEKLLAGAESRAYNLGNGAGISVREVIDEVERVGGRKVPWRMAPRREGDPAILVGSADRARTELGWKPQFPGLSGIVETAWKWHLRSGS